MKRSTVKLVIRRETLRQLTRMELRFAGGAFDTGGGGTGCPSPKLLDTGGAGTGCPNVQLVDTRGPVTGCPNAQLLDTAGGPTGCPLVK